MQRRRPPSELKSATDEHMELMADLVQKLSSELRAGLLPAYEISWVSSMPLIGRCLFGVGHIHYLISIIPIWNIVHGDIKPDNLLITRHGTVKIGDFSVSQAFEDDNDELRRSPGTPVFTAPECILGLTYHGKAADTWAVGITLYCMILGEYPFLGDTLQDTYDRIVNNPIVLPNDMNPQLKNLIEGLLFKDPRLRMTLGDVAEHSWIIGDDGPIPEYLCWCKRKSLLEREDIDESNMLP